MRIVVAAVTIALTALPAAAQTPPFIEAFCDGGIDGRYQHATVELDGTIRASNRHDAARPWPVIATDAEAARRWFAAIETAAPRGPPQPPEIVVADGIECGIELNKGQELVRYDLPGVLDEIVRYVPGYH
jgi:hypothetical protein